MNEFKVFAVFALIVAGGLLSIWVGKSAMEARAYERITGQHVTTWDAMWVELRVMGDAGGGK